MLFLSFLTTFQRRELQGTERLDRRALPALTSRQQTQAPKEYPRRYRSNADSASHTTIKNTMYLYDFPQSPNCRKVRIYLAEKGIPVPLHSVNLVTGEQSASEFLRRNPFGAVPILELDDGTVIPESLAIIEYLEELHPTPPLIGANPLDRALTRAWERRAELGVVLQGTRRFLHFSPFFASRVEQDPKVVAEAGHVLRARLALFNEHLKHHEWLTGAFSLADITLLVGIDFAAESQFALDPTWTHLHRWYEAVQQRPSTTA